MKTADWDAATAQSAALVPFLGCPTSRFTWGDAAHARAGSLRSMKAGACMKPDFGRLVRGSSCPSTVPSSSWIQGCHGISWKSTEIRPTRALDAVETPTEEQDRAADSEDHRPQIVDWLQGTTRYRPLSILPASPIFSQKSDQIARPQGQIDPLEPGISRESPPFPGSDSQPSQLRPVKSQAPPLLERAVLAGPLPTAGFGRDPGEARAATFPFCPLHERDAETSCRTHSRKHMQMLHGSIAAVGYCASAALAYV